VFAQVSEHVANLRKVRGGYREHLQAAVAASVAPYGYTLTIWTSGAITTHAEGLPTGVDALLFLAGAVAGFGLVGAFAHGGAAKVLRPPGESSVRLWGGLHIPSVGLAIAGSSLVGSLFSGSVTWPLVGFFATAIYLLVIAAQFKLATAVARRPGL
jgi:hypothetical protein